MKSVRLRFSWRMLSKNSRPSSYIAERIAAVICGNFSASKVLPASLSRPSHCAPKPSNSARDRGSASSRRAWPASTAGSCSFPASATADNSASGIVAHSK